MGGFNGNPALIFFKWGQEKKSSIVQGFLIFFLDSRTVDISGGTDNNGMGTTQKHCQTFLFHRGMKSVDDRHAGLPKNLCEVIGF